MLSVLEAPDCKSLPVALVRSALAIGRVYGTAMNESTGSGGVVVWVYSDTSANE